MTEIEFQAWPKTPRLNKPVVFTEKIDGCLIFSSPILMADGTSKTINKIEVGDIVMGMEDGNLVPTPVLTTYKNGLTDDWLRVRGKRSSRGRGSADFSIKATPNHKFWVEGSGYVPASDLKVGDTLICTHSDLSLTLTQKSILLGKLLGDGSIRRLKDTAAISWSHATVQDDYIEWTINALGSIARRTGTAVSGYGTDMTRAITVSAPDILDLFSGFDTPNGVIPDRTADMLNPIALAYWYMDDGSLLHEPGQEDRATLSTHALNDESHSVLVRGLKRLGLMATLQATTKGTFIRFNADDADLLFSMIAPYIPPTMQYKLPTYYRGCTGWVPPHSSGFKEALGTVVITDIDKYTPPGSMRAMKYDIETGTHNFFVSRILVHNSNSCVVITDEGEVLAQSRNRFVTPQEDNYGFAGWVRENAEDLITILGPGYHYGEWWGHGIQRGYGLPKGDRRFSLFNINRYGGISRGDFGLGVVPFLGRSGGGFGRADRVLRDLLATGSEAAPGYMNPEGIIAYHTASGQVYKYFPTDLSL